MRKSLVFLVLTILIGFVASLISSKADSTADKRQATKIQAAISSLNEELNATLMAVTEGGKEISSFRTLWREKGIGLVVYQNKRAVHWTTNNLAFKPQYDSRSKPESGIVKLQGSWYICQTFETDGDLLVGYALLRTDFDFENRYIRTGWSEQIPASKRFGLTQTEYKDFPIQINGVESHVGIRIIESHQANTVFDFGSAIWLLFLALLLATIWYTANWVSEISSVSIANTIFAVVLIGIRALLLWWEQPTHLYGLELFGPTPHATSALIPSLGDLLLHLVFLLLIALRSTQTELVVKNAYLRRFLAISVPIVLLYFFYDLINILVTNSSFSLDLNSPFSLDAYSLVGLTTTFVGLLVFYVVQRYLGKLISAEKRTFSSVVPWLVVGALGLFLLIGFDWDAAILSLISAALIGFLFLSQQWLENRSGIYYHTPNILVFSIVSCLILTDATGRNEHDNRTSIVKKLAQKQDPITEYLFEELAIEIREDRQLRVALTNGVLNSDDALAILHRKLSYDHWNRYVSTIDVFSQSGGLLFSDRERTGPNYFELQNSYEVAVPTISEDLKYVATWGVQGGYLARIEIQYPRRKENIIIFISLIPEKTDDILGFTDLFVDESVSTTKELEGYSYAIYSNGELQDKNGDYPYSLTDLTYQRDEGESAYVYRDGYTHLVSRPISGRTIVVSKPTYGALAYLTTFSYIFLFYLVCAGLVALFSGKLVSGILERRSFRNRINLAMSSVSFVSLLLIGVLTVVYVVQEYNQRNKEMISEKSKSVLIEMEHKLRDKEGFTPEDELMLSTLLVKFSKVFFTDINLYHLDGHLLATSRPRLFDEGLMARVIDPEAYEQMRFEQRSSYIHHETIGNLDYMTAYVPFRNEKREVIAIMSLPYFARQYGLQQEIFALLATLTNIYVFLILISVVVALIISNRITEPLRFIRESLKGLKLDETNRAIEWSSNDEIGELVDEYNKTLNELVRSAELLARSERESAWREMAKQVAHEIKNPLTPMKLSIQMLQRSMADGAEDLDQRIERTSKTLIEQIDTLSNIATEFSSFAQMPRSNIESINLIGIIESALELHKNDEAELLTDLRAENAATVMADKDQMLRVLNNLIKNGIQAVPDDRKPQILLGLIKDKNEWVLSVKDNGSGIPQDLQEKIFVPNFTTKSSGMGLGLAMVKNIIESANGNISFVSEDGIGTTFYIRLNAVNHSDG